LSILAIDTATQVSSVAVVKDERLLAEVTMQGKLTHSETLLPHIEQVLKMAATDKKDLTGIAISIGPGSFTGLRIGLAAAKAMSYALHIPLIGVSTLQALAYQFPASGVRIVCLLDAQKGNAYKESYRWENGSLTVIEPVTVEKISDILTACANLDEQVMLLGDVVQKKIAGKVELPADVCVAMPHILMPRAACVALLGQQKLLAGAADNVMALEPVYIRRSEAEVLWEKRHPENEKPATEKL